MRETWVQPLGWEDPLEKEMAAHSSILAWKIPWTVEPINKPRDFLPGSHNIYCDAKTKTVANEISFRKVHHLK